MSALCAKEKPQAPQAQAELSKANSVSLLNYAISVSVREQLQAPRAQVEVSKANYVFLSQGCEHCRCKGETASAAHEQLTASTTGS